MQFMYELQDAKLGVPNCQTAEYKFSITVCIYTKDYKINVETRIKICVPTSNLKIIITLNLKFYLKPFIFLIQSSI